MLRKMNYSRCELRRCQDCGAPVGARDRYCGKCGAKLPREPRAGIYTVRDRAAPAAHC